MFEGQPKGLYALALANTGERFGYYTMLAVFALFLREHFGWSEAWAGGIYSTFLMGVYFLPIVGGALADKYGFGKMVTAGILVMFLGYMGLSIPLGSGAAGITAMGMALALIAFGTGLFKGNLQVMVGNLYDDPRYSSRRDSGFSLFYMAINIGAMFAPTAAVEVMEYVQTNYGVSHDDSYHYAFGVACLSLIVSIAIYYAFRFTFKHVEGGVVKKVAAGEAAQAPVEELTPEQTKQRLVALFLVFAVVIFFWMSFHQNGLTLTYFANDFTAPTVFCVHTMPFNVFNLVLVIVAIYASFGLVQNKSVQGKFISGAVALASLGGLYYQYLNHSASMDVSAPLYQQFNPCFVVALTPFAIALWGYLGARGKEPSSPRKIALGMLVAAAGFVVMALGSWGLPTPAEQEVAVKAGTAIYASPYVLIFTYLVLTFGELLLSPIGISFVSKVAPPKYKGLMMGAWFAASALGNFLVSVGGFLWGLPLWIMWSVFAILCVLSALFMFAMMKRLEAVS